MSQLSAGPVCWRSFFRYAVPSVSAMLLFSLYTVVDGVFVAQGVGETALTAVNIALPFVNALSGFSILISMGTATLCSFALGRGDKAEAERLFTQTVVVILAVSLLCTAAVSLFAEPLALFLGAEAETLPDAVTYLRIVCLFSVCFILSYCMEVMVKVDDNPRMAVFGVGASFVTNIALDALFIFMLDWGVAGAAWATGIAQVVSLALFLHYFLRRSQLRFRRFAPRPRLLLRIFPLGVADCSVELIVGFLTMLYNNLLFSLVGSAGQTVYAVLAYANLFVFMVMQGCAQGMMHLGSLYLGRGDTDSARRCLGYCAKAVLVLGGAATLLCLAFPQGVVSLLLAPDSPQYADALLALRLFALSFPLVGLNITLAGYCTAWEKPLQAALLSLGRGFVLLPLTLLLFTRLAGYPAVWLAAISGEALCLLLALPVMKKSRFSAHSLRPAG